MRSVYIALTFSLLSVLLVGCQSGKFPERFDDVTQTGAYSLCLNHNGSQAIVGSIHHGGSLWRVKPLDRLFNWNHQAEQSSNILNCAFSPSGSHAATTDNRTIALWNAVTGEAFWLWNAPGDIQDLALTPEGNFALLGMEDYTATLFDIKNGGIERLLKHDGIVYDVSLSKDARVAATASDDLTAGVWKITTGERLHTFNHDNQVRTAQLSADGQRLLTSALGEDGYVWDLSSGKKVATLPLNSGFFSAARFSDDGRQLLTGSSAGKVQLWTINGAKLISTWQAVPRNRWVSNNVQIEDVAFDGNRYIASGSNGRLFHLK